MSFISNLENIKKRHRELSDLLQDAVQYSSGDVAQHSKEFSNLSPLVEQIEKYEGTVNEIADLQSLIDDKDTEKEVQEMANEELISLQTVQTKVEYALKLMLIPKDEADAKNAIIEIRAGTGGDEAALFAYDLFAMYQRYAEIRNWKFEIMHVSETGIGGYKEASAIISGHNVFYWMKFESGTHRVQRIPDTESSGRIHTSAATVAVLPEAEEVDVKIDDKDLRIDIFRASGPGGQSVNTTDSAVRIVHIPTGIVVQQQDEKSQHKNKAKALKILRSRLYEHERSKIDNERASDRKQQIGSGDRSERIRTYNFPQGRVSDHRINLTLYKIEEIVKEGKLNEIIESLIADEQSRKLSGL